MSEPVIKAVGMHCPKCRTNTDEHRRAVLGGDPWMHCSWCDADTVEVYTRDDLVLVARETFIACGYEKDADAGGDVEIVDRLTKGET